MIVFRENYGDLLAMSAPVCGEEGVRTNIYLYTLTFLLDRVSQDHRIAFYHVACKKKFIEIFLLFLISCTHFMHSFLMYKVGLLIFLHLSGI